MHIELTEHAPVLAVVAAAAVPLVVEEGALVVVDAVPDIGGIDFATRALSVVSAAGGNEIIIRNFAQVVPDRIDELLQVLRRRRRATIEQEGSTRASCRFLLRTCHGETVSSAPIFGSSGMLVEQT